MSDSMSNEFLSQITKKQYFVIWIENLRQIPVKNVDFRQKILEVAISKSGDFEKWIISKIVSF